MTRRFPCWLLDMHLRWLLRARLPGRLRLLFRPRCCLIRLLLPRRRHGGARRGAPPPGAARALLQSPPEDLDQQPDVLAAGCHRAHQLLGQLPARMPHLRAARRHHHFLVCLHAAA
jgi:hypothetical protein